MIPPRPLNSFAVELLVLPDGREFLVTSSTCTSIQGESGRSISGVDISPFITALPGGVDTTSFSTQDASGSTSMAAGVVEVCVYCTSVHGALAESSPGSGAGCGHAAV